MRLILSCVVVALIAGCSHPDNPDPALIISPSDPSGTVSITEPTNFSAIIENTTSDETVTWTLAGGGNLSASTGLHVVYTPPPGTATATLTAATADGLTATVQVASGPMTLTSQTIPGLLAPVKVEYDAQDIPHIRCQTKIDCVAVQGYVHAHDRFFMMDFLRHVARAHLAEMIGVDGLAQDVQIRTLFTTRAGHRLEDDLVAAMDADSATVVNAYAAGVNAFLGEVRAKPSLMPGEYKQLPFPIAPADIAEWTPQDTLAAARLQQFQLSETIEEETANGQFYAVYGQGGTHQDLAKVDAWIRAAAPAGEQAHTLSDAPHTVVQQRGVTPTTSLAAYATVLTSTRAQFDALRDRLRPMEATVGSNNWVIAGAKSATHVSMVANDPHLSLQYPPLFHLSAMTSATASDNLDLTGGSFPGIPGALVGRGAHVGWGVTVVGYDVTDVYLETVLPIASCLTAAPCVSFKGAPTPLLVVPQTFLVRTKDGLVNANTLTGITQPPAAVLIAPQHGPLVQPVNIVTGGPSASVRWTGQEGNTDDLRAILGLNTATDVDSAMAALKDFSTGAQNFVLADDQGHIAYDPHALVPVRKFTEGASPKAPWFPLPGDGTAEWGDGVADCASAGATPLPAACWIADSALPQGKDPAKGYYFTANADPTATGVSDDNNPLGHPPYLSFDWDDSTGFRATRIQERIEAALAASGNVSLEDMMSIQSDHVSRPGKFFAAYIASLPTTGDSADLTAAKAILATWLADGADCPTGLTGTDPSLSGVDTSGTVPADSAGCFLFHAFLRDVVTNVFTDDLAVAGQGVSQLQAIKALMYMLTAPAANQATTNTFCNNVAASGAVVAVRTCDAQVELALTQAYDDITAKYQTQNNWLWGRVHTMQPLPLLALITTNYQPGPYARPGGAFTVDVGTPSTSASGLAFPFGASGNVRHISLMDPAKPVVKMQLPGPERDVPVLFGGPDLLLQWVKNQYFDYATSSQIDAVVVSTQTFTAH
jgi:penicillin amidase